MRKLDSKNKSKKNGRRSALIRRPLPKKPLPLKKLCKKSKKIPLPDMQKVPKKDQTQHWRKL